MTTERWGVTSLWSFAALVALGFAACGGLMKLTVEANSLPSIELQALQDLFDSTEGTSWIWLQPSVAYGYPWNFSTPQNPCSSTTPWQGIKCSSTCVDTACNVVYLYLPDTNLKGEES
jgi:hypothetical protein